MYTLTKLHDNSIPNVGVGVRVRVGVGPVEFQLYFTRVCLQVNGIEVLYTNCDETPNSQMTIFANLDDNRPTRTAYRKDFVFCRNLLASLEATASGSAVPNEYFAFLEISFGGQCGCFTQTDRRPSIQDITKATIGFR